MRTSSRWLPRLAVVAALLAAAVLRAPGHAFPPGLYHDEAFYGLDGLTTLTDGPQLWYAANNGREPLFIWLVALSEWALGPMPATARLPIVTALRLPALAAGLVLVAAMFALAARLAGRRAGLIAAALTAVLPWAALLGRTGLRAGLLPPVLALAAAASLRGIDRGDRRWVVFGGALAGLSLYTYTAARALPAAVGIALVVWMAAARGGARSRRTPAGPATDLAKWPATGSATGPWTRPMAWLAPAVLVALPLVVVIATTPGALFGRLAQVAVTGGGERVAGASTSMPLALVRGVLRTAGMVFLQGDRIVRHNIPFRPVFGPLAGGLWAIGLIVLLAWMLQSPSTSRTSSRLSAGRRRRGAAVILGGTLAYSLPTALAADAPHFLRAVGLLPALVATAAVGGAALVGWAGGRWGQAGRIGAWAAVALAVALEGRDVMRYDAALDAGRSADPLAERTVPVVPDSPDITLDGDESDAASAAAWARAYHAFEGGATVLAREVNALLPPLPSEPTPGTPNGKRVWLDRRLRDGWASVPFLVPIDRVTLTDPYDPVLFDDGGDAFLVPYGLNLDEVWSKLPSPAGLSIRQPMLERGDLAPRASPLYVKATGPREDGAQDLTNAIGRTVTVPFAGGPVLFGAEIAPQPIVRGPRRPPWTSDERAIRIRTSWWRDGDARPPGEPIGAEPLADEVTLFVHVVDPNGHRLDQGADAPLGQGVYPVGRWRPGDTVTDERLLWLPASARGARIIIGLYARDPTSPLRRLDGYAEGDGTTVEIGRVP